MPALRSKVVVPLACLLVGLVVVLPLLAPGFVLTYDMVFVPHPRWSAELLGISPTLPRTVPTGLWVAAASSVVGGQVVQKVVLVGTFAGGAFAAARLVPARGTAARLAAGVLYVWNPFTYERLVFGHWALLLGYAILPAAVGTVAVVLVLVPVGLAPTLAWGAAGRLGTADYPPSWDQVQAVTAADPDPGAILVLPWHAYVPFGWNDDHPVRQPAPFWFSRDVVSSTSLELGPVALPHEHPWSRLADPFVTGPPDPDGAAERLAAMGVRYVVLQHEADAGDQAWLTTGLSPVLDTPDLSLSVVPGSVRVPDFDTPPTVPVVLADVLFAAMLVLAALRSRDTLRPRNAGIAPEGTAMLADAGPEGGTTG